ncbi:hypothetical protein SCYZ1_7 [Pseudomonas phage SCYZ1]|nr:hypothetical protein SCYZ1_7 [Pseudomonas phage SCYZ1]
MMKRILIVGMLAATTMLAGCSPAKVSNGYTGVVVNMMGSGKGVDPVETGVGWKWLTFNEELFKFPTFNQNVNYPTLIFQDANGMEVSANIGLTLRAAPGSAPLLFKTFRRGMDEIVNVNVQQVLRTSLNSAGSKRGSDKMYGQGQDQFLAEVFGKVRDHFADRGLIIENLYLNGKINLPPSVVATITAQVEATQKTIQRQNEVAQVVAEAEKKVAEAQGEKDSAILRAQGEAESLTIRGEALRKNPGMVELNAIDKWDGKLPTVTAGNNALPFINIK